MMVKEIRKEANVQPAMAMMLIGLCRMLLQLLLLLVLLCRQRSRKKWRMFWRLLQKKRCRVMQDRRSTPVDRR
jgi:ABC-type sulfate transport system permease component